MRLDGYFPYLGVPQLPTRLLAPIEVNRLRQASGLGCSAVVSLPKWEGMERSLHHQVSHQMGHNLGFLLPKTILQKSL
jgi:hypothetical protein